MSTRVIDGPHLNAGSPASAAACAGRVIDTALLMVRCIRTRMREQLPGLTVSQFRLMAFLYRQRDASLTDLADHLGVTRSTASGLVDRFVRHGLATRTLNTANRRQVKLRLTRRGAAQFEVATRAARRDAMRRLAGLPPRQVRALCHSLDLLAGAFGDTEVTRT